MVTLAALAVEVQTLADRVAALERQPRRGRCDPLADGRLLSAIAAGLGSAVFSASELIEHARHDPELQRALDGASARRLGKWLRRLSAQPPGDGYQVQRLTRDGSGVLWAVVSAD